MVMLTMGMVLEGGESGELEAWWGGVQWCKMPRRGKGWQTFDIHESAHIRDFDFFLQKTDTTL